VRVKRYQPTRHLPVVFHSLDVEGKTKAVPALICPVRADLMTVGSCGRCEEFRRIEFTQDGHPVLCCAADQHGEVDAEVRVQSALRVPAMCTAPDTTLETALQYAMLAEQEDAITVLDWDSNPIGFVTLRELKQLEHSGIPPTATLSEVMSQQIVCVLPETTLADACELLAVTAAAQLFVVGADGSFLGLVTPRDLAEQAGPKRRI
jgi:CBS domain-containing protein